MNYSWINLKCAKYIASLIFVLGALQTAHLVYQNERHFPTSLSWRPNEDGQPVHHIMFLKTHKCASSALQNIFMRYAYNHNLSVALPEIYNYLGNPLPFQSYFVPPSLLPKEGKVDIFAVHSRLNVPEHRKILHGDAIFITAVRNPVTLFESLYNFFAFKYFNGLSLRQYLDLPFEKIVGMDRVAGKFGPNMMLFDLGYDVDWNTSDHEIENIITEIDRIFSIVMIAERLDESLILAKNLLRWNYIDIIVYEKNARRKKYKQQLPVEQQKLVQKLSKGDEMLYKHFVRRHEAAVQTYGKEKMAAEVAVLQAMRDEVSEQCGMRRQQFLEPDKKIFQEYSFFVDSIVIDDPTNKNCFLLSIPELQLMDEMRSYQKELLLTMERQ